MCHLPTSVTDGADNFKQTRPAPASRAQPSPSLRHTTPVAADLFSSSFRRSSRMRARTRSPPWPHHSLGTLGNISRPKLGLLWSSPSPRRWLLPPPYRRLQASASPPAPLPAFQPEIVRWALRTTLPPRQGDAWVRLNVGVAIGGKRVADPNPGCWVTRYAHGNGLNHRK